MFMFKLEVISFLESCGFKIKTVLRNFIDIIKRDIQLAFFGIRMVLYKIVGIMKFFSMFSLIPGLYYAYKTILIFKDVRLDFIHTNEFALCISCVAPYIVLSFIEAILKYDS